MTERIKRHISALVAESFDEQRKTAPRRSMDVRRCCLRARVDRMACDERQPRTKVFHHPDSSNEAEDCESSKWTTTHLDAGVVLR